MKKLLVLLLLLALFVGCRAESEEITQASLAGTWSCSDCADHSWFCNLTFDENGFFRDSAGDSGDFTIAGRVIVFNWNQEYESQRATVALSGDTLRFSIQGDRDMTLVRA